jgi:hypothetical protein
VRSVLNGEAHRSGAGVGSSETSQAEFQAELNELLKTLGRWRSTLLANTYIAHQGPRVFQGPFVGMEYATSATSGAHMPRLLGTYESELYPYLLQFAQSGLEEIIVLGCAEGYYAVGLASRSIQSD